MIYIRETDFSTNTTVLMIDISLNDTYGEDRITQPKSSNGVE
jgi:hypothetical protein